MKAVELISAYGHNAILATHESTLEITRDRHLTRRGNCIIAVAADKGVRDLNKELKRILMNDDAKLTIVIGVAGEQETVEAWGSSNLTLKHLTDMVVRQSTYICDRTLAIKANKAARDLSRRLVAKLKNPQQKVCVTLTVEEGRD